MMRRIVLGAAFLAAAIGAASALSPPYSGQRISPLIKGVAQGSATAVHPLYTGLKRSIVMIGGSVIWGDGLDQTETYAAIMQRQIDKTVGVSTGDWVARAIHTDDWQSANNGSTYVFPNTPASTAGANGNCVAPVTAPTNVPMNGGGCVAGFGTGDGSQVVGYKSSAVAPLGFWLNPTVPTAFTTQGSSKLNVDTVSGANPSFIPSGIFGYYGQTFYGSITGTTLTLAAPAAGSANPVKGTLAAGLPITGTDNSSITRSITITGGSGSVWTVNNAGADFPSQGFSSPSVSGPTAPWADSEILFTGSGQNIRGSMAWATSNQNYIDIGLVGNGSVKLFVVDSASTPLVLTFTLNSAQTVSAGAVYSNNGSTFTVLQAVSSSTLLPVGLTSGTGPSVGGTLTLVSGTGPATISFSSASSGVVVGVGGLGTSTTTGVNNNLIGPFAASAAGVGTFGINYNSGNAIQVVNLWPTASLLASNHLLMQVMARNSYCLDDYINQDGSDIIDNGYAFLLSGAAGVTAGATYTNNGVTFTVTRNSSSTVLWTQATSPTTGQPAASGTLTLASGSGPATLTYSWWSGGTGQSVTSLIKQSVLNSYDGGVATDRPVYIIGDTYNSMVTPGRTLPPGNASGTGGNGTYTFLLLSLAKKLGATSYYGAGFSSDTNAGRVVLVMPFVEGGLAQTPNSLGYSPHDYRVAIQGLAKTYGFDFIDQSLMPSIPNHSNLITSDYLHPSAAQYDAGHASLTHGGGAEWIGNFYIQALGL